MKKEAAEEEVTDAREEITEVELIEVITEEEMIEVTTAVTEAMAIEEVVEEEDHRLPLTPKKNS